MNPTRLILTAWGEAIKDALPDIKMVYFSEIDGRSGSDDETYLQTGSAQPEMPYVEILSFDTPMDPLGNAGLETHMPKTVVCGYWPRDTANQDRTIKVHDIGDIGYTVRSAINARMLAHNHGTNRVEGVGMTTLIRWTLKERPSLDGQTKSDQFALEAAFTHFPIPGT